MKTIVNEILTAIKLLGYPVTKKTVSIRQCSPGDTHFEVHMADSYFGIWDSVRKTFVD